MKIVKSLNLNLINTVIFVLKLVKVLQQAQTSCLKLLPKM